MIATGQKELKQKLDKFSNLPSIPQVISRIKQISENPKSSAADLANCILSDHQLTSRILRMANSPYYGEFSGKITTVTHAIVLMGFRAIRNIAISMAVYGVVNSFSRNSKFDLVSFWTRSLACGVIAKFLAHHINRPTLGEAAFIAGFMHDIGQVILAGVFPEKYEEISREEAERPDVYRRERALLQIDHLKAGEHIGRKWNLPDGLIEPIVQHHRINKAPMEKSENIAVDLVYLADRIYPHVMGGTPPTAEVYVGLIEEAQVLTGVSKDSMLELLSVCREQVAEIALDLEIEIEREFGKRAVPEEYVSEIHRQLHIKEVQLAFLQNVSEALREAKTADEILQVICEAAFRGLQMGRAILFEYNPGQDCFAGRVGFGLESQEAVKVLSFPAESKLFKHLRETGEPISVVDENDDIYGNLFAHNEPNLLGAQAFAAVPIRILDEVQYVIFADAPNRDVPIDDETLRSLVSLANQGALTLERNLFKTKLKK